MKTEAGWNMHSVVEVAPMTETDTKVAAAIDVLSTHVPEWLDHPTTNFSALKTITTSPRASLRHLRGLADKLGFLLMPFAYLDPRSYAEEPWEIQRAIRGFTDELSSKFLLYVLCPLEHYSLAKHIEAEDLPIHVPTQYAQAFMALDMCLPVFRNMRNDMSRMREDISALSRKLELNIRAQQERAERERMRLRDPMMVAIPKDRGVQGDGPALIGPAWGPDIEEILLQSYKLTAKPAQRKMIEASVLKLYGSGGRPMLPESHKHPFTVHAKTKQNPFFYPDPDFEKAVARQFPSSDALQDHARSHFYEDYTPHIGYSRSLATNRMREAIEFSKDYIRKNGL